VPQAADGSEICGRPLSDLMTVDGDRLKRIELDRATLPDLERLA
jgi:hypothetical protein